MIFLYALKRGDNLEIKVFIHFFFHSYMFGGVYMGQPYFQASLNESQVYLGHFTLKKYLLPGDCSASFFRNELLLDLCPGVPGTFPMFQPAQWCTSQICHTKALLSLL